MDIRTLIPKDKFDLKTAERLNNFSYSEIRSIVPDLLVWIQDMNWPISKPIAEYLQTIAEEISDDILKILHGDDEMWKYWVIGVFGGATQNSEVLKEIHRIATHPTKGEKECEVDEQALRFLNGIPYKV